MDHLSNASREVMWNVSNAWVIYLLLAASLLIFAYGLYLRIRFWKQGRADNERLSDWGRRIVLLLREFILQKRLRSSKVPGVFHSLIFYSFLVLFVTTAVIAMDSDLGTDLFRGYLYGLLSLASDIGGLLILIGVGMAGFRRYVTRPKTLENRLDDAWSLLLIGLIVATGFLIEGLRMATIQDHWPWLSPVGWGTAQLFSGIPGQGARTAHVWLWWLHALLAMAWIASIPYTKFFHLLALPANVFFSKLAPRGELRHQDIEAMMASENPEDLRIGLEKASDFTWKHRLEFDACTGCGRCEEVCPAYLANQPFSPRRMIANLKNLTRAYGNGNGKAESASEDAKPTCVQGGHGDGAGSIVGGAFDEEFIWYCRTCTACMEVCPAFIEHADTFIEIRRNEVLMQGRMPPDAQRALKMLETLGNPFGPQETRVNWIEELNVRVVKPGEKCDVIYWIGCCTAFDQTKQKVARDICKLLEKCGFDFGVLGSDEMCCGDPARVLGQEHLFQTVAKTQIEKLNTRQFRALLVSCPHCYNVLKHEYAQLGGDFPVVHHSEFLHEALWSGALHPRMGFEGRYVYHDPCYLGRYQKIYQAPREVIMAIPGVELIEMKNHRDKSLCCGGGGGHYWMDLHVGERINNLRVQQSVDAKADTIVTGCAFCKQMIEDSVKLLDRDEEIRVVDLATLVLESLGEPESRPYAVPADAR